MDREFNPIELPRKWADLFGQIELPTHILLTGKGGTGKTGMSLVLGEDFTKLKKRVLLASKEQFNSPTLRKLIEDVGLQMPNPYFYVQPAYETDTYNPSMFDLVIIDSKDSYNLEPSDFEALVHTYPKTSFVLMSQSNKDGVFSGSGKWQNVVDIMLEVHERGKMRVGDKNRWGHYGEIELFKTK